MLETIRASLKLDSGKSFSLPSMTRKQQVWHNYFPQKLNYAFTLEKQANALYVLIVMRMSYLIKILTTQTVELFPWIATLKGRI